MGTIEQFVKQGKLAVRTAEQQPWVRTGAELGTYFLSGLALSAASLGGGYLCILPGILCTVKGMPAILLSLGGLAGCRVFWGAAGTQAAVWILLSLGVGLLLSGRAYVRSAPLLLPAVAALIPSGTGLVFSMFFREQTGIFLYFLRVASSSLSAALALSAARGRTAVTDALLGAVAALALSRLQVGWFRPGLCLAGFLCAGGTFPAAVVAGAVLDIAGEALPMGAVMALGFSPRLLPERWRKLCILGPGAAMAVVSGVLGGFDWQGSLCLTLGGLLSFAVPFPVPIQKRAGRTGSAQVGLELAANVMERWAEVTADTAVPPVDTASLLSQTAYRACRTCPNKKNCRQSLTLSPALLTADTPRLEDIPCRKPGRVIQELTVSRNQYRLLLADRARQENLLAAVGQQYRFTSRFLRSIADSFSRVSPQPPRFCPETAVCSAGKASVNGDAGLWFSGTGNRFFMLLCDGMGTGSLAAKESRNSAAALKHLLQSGYAVEDAMQSLSSLCYLRGTAGIVTADLAEVNLDTGRVSLYKWGACPTYLIRGRNTETLGGDAPPLGLSPEKRPETKESLRLRSGDVLIMITDGVGGVHLSEEFFAASPGEIASAVLRNRDCDTGDDATVMVMRLMPLLP